MQTGRVSEVLSPKVLSSFAASFVTMSLTALFLTGSASAQATANSLNSPPTTPPATAAPAQTTPAPTPPATTQTPAQATPTTTQTTQAPSTQTPDPNAKTDADAQDAGPQLQAIKGDSGDLPPVPMHVKPGSIDDVNAIGNREIGARGIGNWYSTEGEIKMGKQYAMEIEHTIKLIQDPVVTEYVNRIGQNLVKNSDAKVPFTIKVIDSDEINAMALPGGFFYVNSGLILAADEEAELAGVMAHEIGHVAAHHVAREMTRMQYAQLGMIPLIFVGGWTGYGIYEAASIAVPMTFLEFSRGFEAQADYLGLQYMYKAGYDPQAFVAFFEKIQALQKHKPGAVAKAFATHPQTPDRIQHSQEEMARILPARDEYVVSTSEFQDVKARLARIENRRKLTDSKDTKKPSLRRTSAPAGGGSGTGTGTGSGGSTTGNTTGNDPNTTGDDTPTLHRRDN